MLRRISQRFVIPNGHRLAQRFYTEDKGGNVDNPFAINWKQRQDQTRKSAKIDDDPENTSFIFFPGQGSQYVGMVKDLLQYAEVKNMFEIANEVLRLVIY